MLYNMGLLKRNWPLPSKEVFSETDLKVLTNSHSFFQQLFIKLLLCAGQCCGSGGFTNEDKNFYLHGASHYQMSKVSSG